MATKKKIRRQESALERREEDLRRYCEAIDRHLKAQKKIKRLLNGNKVPHASLQQEAEDLQNKIADLNRSREIADEHVQNLRRNLFFRKF